MKLFEGKSPTERNKTIAALVLGVLSVAALAYNFGGSLIGGRKTTVTVSASPSPTNSPRRSAETVSMPSREEQNLLYTTMPVRYEPGNFYAPDAGRNIFAFYEPPPPTPYVPPPPSTPTPEIIPPPSPTPTPEFLVGFVTPQSVYAGSKTFRMEVNGDRFTPESLIYLNGNQLPTTFVSQQKLVADVPSNLITSAGSLYIIVRTPDNRLYSNQVALTIQAPPIPQFRYIGMIARARSNNDTAYFEEQGKTYPINARLNDVVGGRFRLTSISANETVFEDVNLGFKHRLALYRPAPGQTTGSNNPGGQQNPDLSPGRFPRGNPNMNNPNPPGIPYNVPAGEIPGIPGSIPGIPSNIPIYVPPAPNPQNKQTKDEDDDGN